MSVRGIYLHRRKLRRFSYSLQHSIVLGQSSKWQVTVVVIFLVATIMVSILASGSRLAPTKPVAIRPKHVITTSADHPSEAPIIASTYHSTATGDQPKYLDLPTIHAQGYIQAVGVDQHQQIAVPNNIHLAGWFTSSVTPGTPGLSIIDGHLDGYRLPGIFANLAKLKSGDHFNVTLATGQVRSFDVLSVQSLPLAQAGSVLFSQVPGVTSELNLITCGGEFNANTGYDHRIIISASLSN